MSSPQAVRNAAVHDPELELLGTDDPLQEEMRRLAAINQELLGKTRLKSLNTSIPEASETLDDAALLQKENAELRARIEELERALQSGSPEGVSWEERQKEYE